MRTCSDPSSQRVSVLLISNGEAFYADLLYNTLDFIVTIVSVAGAAALFPPHFNKPFAGSSERIEMA